MSYFGGLFSTVFERRFARAVSSDAQGRSIQDLCLDLLGAQGEISGSALAQLILDRYAQEDVDGKQAFFEFMLNDLEFDPVEIVESLKHYIPLRQRPERCISASLASARHFAVSLCIAFPLAL